MKKLFLIIAVALAAVRAWGSNVSDTAQQQLIQDFSGGLNTSFPSHKLATNFSPYMRNVFIDNGKIERINGFVTLGSSGALTKVTGIFPFVRENGQTTFLVTDSSITIETTGDFKSWIFVSSGSNTGGLLTWMQVRNKMWGFNGLDSVMTWDGTTKTNLNGLGTTPSVPKFRYGAYYQDRVFGLGIPNGASDLYFTSTITTDNVIITPDDARAWPPINATFVGRGDGQIGTALWVYQGLLRAGKEQSIYTVYGDNPSNYLPRKEQANIGVVSNESVRIQDGQSHYLGQTGIYRDVQRISDLIEPDIANINKGITNIITNAWDTQIDFGRGQFIYGTTATPTGLLTLGTSDYRMNWSDGQYPQVSSPTAFIEFSSTQNQTTQFAVIAPTGAVPNTFLGFFGGVVKAITLNTRCAGINPGGLPIVISFLNTRTGERIDTTDPGPCTFTSDFRQHDFSANGQIINLTGDDIINGNFRIMVATTSNIPAGTIFQFFPSTITGFADITYAYHSTTGNFLSDVATNTSVTAWGNFDSNRNTSGGNIVYWIRSSTSVVNISTQIWKSIAPGSIISEPTANRFIQWASTIQSVGTMLGSIDNVTISHVEGQASDARPFAMDWLNRYWLAVTTTSDYTKRMIYVKSKISNATPDAWMPIEGPPVDCFAKAGNIFYAGSASTNSIYRLDFGTNFDGQPINSIYDTPDIPLGNYFMDKNIFKYLIDGAKSNGGTMTIGSSVNGADFINSTYSISGTGRYNQIIEGVTRPVRTLRLRLQNKETDIGLGIYNVDILYEPTKVLSNK